MKSMYLFWRLLIALLAAALAIVIFIVFIMSAVFNVKVSPNLPDLNTHNIPPADTIIPRLAKSAAIAMASTTTTQYSSTPTPTQSSPTSTTIQHSSTPASGTTTKPNHKKKSTTENRRRDTDNLEALQIAISPEQCLDFAIACRDIQCAFEDFNVTCDNPLGPVCTCGIIHGTI